MPQPASEWTFWTGEVVLLFGAWYVASMVRRQIKARRRRTSRHLDGKGDAQARQVDGPRLSATVARLERVQLGAVVGFVFVIVALLTTVLLGPLPAWAVWGSIVLALIAVCAYGVAEGIKTYLHVKSLSQK